MLSILISRLLILKALTSDEVHILLSIYGTVNINNFYILS